MQRTGRNHPIPLGPFRLTGAFLLALALSASATAAEPAFRLARFRLDVTIPLGHRCMGILPTKAQKIVDPLYAHGLVLCGPDKPIVLLAVDWCEIRNGAYDHWRQALAKAAGTERRRVLLCALHQHDAPVVDREAQQMLDEVGLEKELHDPAFFGACVERSVSALKAAMQKSQPVTHIGLGKAKVEQVASNRRVVGPDGRVTFGRGSGSGGNRIHAEAPEGEIDPWLRTISLWQGDKPLAAIHQYATHPMSYYGKGGVSADFVGLARRMRSAQQPGVFQMYVAGCSGDVTAGKYNDRSPSMRPVLAERLHDAMQRAWQATRRVPFNKIDFRHTEVHLPYTKKASRAEEALEARLADDAASRRDRILAAMSLSSLRRVQRQQPIDLPVVDFGPAQIVLFPGETFVGFQLWAQRLRREAMVMAIGYGECWPGYIPTRAAFNDHFDDVWLWVDRGSEEVLHAAVRRVLPQPGETGK